MMAALLTEFGGWIVAVLAALAGAVGIYFKGRSSGRQDERIERDHQINQQAEQARKEVRNVQEQTASMSDSDIDDYLTNNWVRNKSTPEKGGR